MESVIVLEPSDTSLKLVVGYVLDEKPVILYANNIPYDNQIKNGIINDPRSFVEFIKSHTHIEDKKAMYRFDIKKAIIVLPPIGFEIYEDKKTSYVVSQLGKVEQIDVNNILSMMKKNIIKAENSIVDIIPLTYYTDEKDSHYAYPPLGANSRYLSMRGIIYSLPTKILNSYSSVFLSSGVFIKRLVISPCAIANLYARKKDMPDTYLYLDYGANYSSISLINRKTVFSSSYFLNGGNYLTNFIADKFNIDIKEAEKIKRRYGYDDREYKFNPIICESVDKEGNNQSYSIQDLANVIKEYLDNYFYEFDTCLNKILSLYPADKRDFPIFLGGGASRLAGFLKYFKKVHTSSIIKKIPLTVIGVRHETYLNAIGAILAHHNYLKAFENPNNENNSLTRANALENK